MSKMLKPNISGYVCNWLVSGPKLTTPQVDFFDQNQLAFEKRLRGVIADDSLKTPPREIAVGRPGLDGQPWSYYVAGNNWFVDFGVFYHLLTKVELYAYTELTVAEPRTVQARVRTFTAMDLWLNDEHIANIAAPVYKPIRNKDVTLHLNAGTNRIFIRIQDLGVRDTRTILGLQLLGDTTGIAVTLPDEDGSISQIIEAEDWLRSVSYADGQLTAPAAPPCPAEVTVYETIGGGHGGMAGGGKTTRAAWQSETALSVDPTAQGINIAVKAAGETLQRDIELVHNVRPKYAARTAATLEEHRLGIMQKLADVQLSEHVSGVFWASYYVLARCVLGRYTEQDNELLKKELELINKRIDCADFLVASTLRIFLKHRPADPDLNARMKEVMLDFRYWMDENGSDGMCFWSENHALLFFGCQMMAGKLYPDEVFTRSGRTGREQYELGAQRCREWLDSVDDTLFEEFLSGGYMSVTSDALLNLVDFGPADVSEKATRVLDKLLRQLALHTYDGMVCGPRGRVYRDVIWPFRQDVQSLMHYIEPSVPEELCMWTAVFGDTKYQIPTDLAQLMRTPTEQTYPCGNGEITLRKTDDYILTSVASPRIGNKGWSNEAYVTEDPYKTGHFTYMYTKALNERFHGTTLFQPGVYGYQQHMWYASLTNDCAVFANHPGATHDYSSMRPGYWYGNGLMPAIRQQGNTLGAVYVLREEHPVTFTHLYWPTQSFDEEVRSDAWVFGRKGDSYIGVWCNVPFVPHNDVLIDRELRAYAEKIAYLCVCSGKQETGTFADFMAAARAKAPAFDPDAQLLHTADGLEVKFVEHHNDSQYI